MRKSFKIKPLLAVLCACTGVICARGAEGDPAGPLTMDKDIAPVLEEYCFDCHNPDKHKGDVNLEDLSAKPKFTEDRETWDKVAEVVENGDMPPEKKPQLSDSQRQLILHYLDGQLSKADCTVNKNPGRVTIRRLNRKEYRNTIRDLLHVDYSPQDFPNDEVGYGFDNIGDVLSLSPLLMEKFMAAAEEVTNKAIATDARARPPRYKGTTFRAAQEEAVRPLDDETLGFYTEGEASRDIDFPKPGDYVIRLRSYGDQAGLEPPKLAVSLDGKQLKIVEVPVSEEAAATYEVQAQVEKGSHRITMAYLNNYVDQNNPNPKLRGDRNVYVKYVEVQGTGNAAVDLPESHRLLITKMPLPGEEHTVARELLTPFLQRAYRRPVSETEVERIAAFVDLALKQKASFLEGMQVAVQAVLCSPQFLFRWELDSRETKPGEVRELNDYQLASRLSYFLWNSMPDDQLAALAGKGELRQGDNLEKQVQRMLHDWKSQEFADNFASQWLQIHNIWEVDPAPEFFPKWNGELKEMMSQEVRLFFESIMKEDRDVMDLVDANYTFLNDKLARYYGIEGVEGKEFRRVQLPPDSPRGGVITMGGVLLATSTPTRTSPVIRGKWILEQILGTPPPAPPPDVPPLPEQKINASVSLRQRLEEHMARTECAGCHKRMDPLGFALENFDATGAFRTTEGKFPIDASGKLPNGKAFNGARELKAMLKNGKSFKVALTEKMLTYALGRGVESYDRCAVDAIVTRLNEHGNKFSELILGIVESDPFLKRKEPDALAQN